MSGEPLGPIPSTREPRSSTPALDARGAGASLAPPVPRARSSWIDRLGTSGALLAMFGLTVVDVMSAILPWASVPLTIGQTLVAIPWVLLVLRDDAAERRAAPAASRRGARLAHVVNIGLFLFALGEKWAFLVRGLAGESAEPFVSGYRSFAVVALLVAVLGLLGRGRRAQRFLADSADHPAKLMVLSFGLSAFVGAILLSLPEAVTDVRHVSFLDALFTAMSAVCVTGLAVNDVPATYTSFGEIVILALAQIGGLGIMVLSASFAVLAGRTLRVKQTAVLAEMIDAGSLAALRRTLIAIVGYTLTIEAIGAGLLYTFAGSHPEVALGADHPDAIAGAGSRVWWAVFHSVSAFCNAGFSLSHGSLTGFAASWPICLTVAALILLGGIGFPIIDELRRALVDRSRRRRPDRLSLHARVALATSGGLVAIVMVLVLVLEWNNTLAHLPWHARVLAAFFHAVTTRTAGFNTIDTGALHPATLALTCVVMFIGASPGSTGGGIKTTTFAAIFAEFRAEIRGQSHARLYDRQLAPTVVRRAIGVVFLCIGLIAIVTMVLLVTEDQPPLAVFFEVVSAFGTVGLSTGITGDLTPIGKLAIVATMFAGRIGPLTLAVALAAEVRRVPVQLATERMMIG